ncbi:CPBP family intramembrane glutamic endopeptidase [Bacillus sp. FJAT-45350]|uniref:CPBP family intramembrane glutamic endopeptidase n=1 Tax=Bacillus sp. FJAT-45350 TaxID=2011014 RepID=UPI000BB6A56F|nr:CPBP family intramembrane glutamic endopeptidase [Bacillus sp. FJAT-45350]
MNKQAKLIEQMTDKEILKNLYATQLIMLFLAIGLAVWLFDDVSDFFAMFHWNPYQIFVIGGAVAVAVVIVDLLLLKIFPKDMLDDGGINERVFAKRSVFHIFIIALIVAISEELLFRGVLQSNIGYIPASLLFALIHFRYLSKIVLFIVTIMLSFLLGYIFLLTGNLLVTIFIHFLIDFILGFLIMFTSSKKGLKER